LLATDEETHSPLLSHANKQTNKQTEQTKVTNSADLILKNIFIFFFFSLEVREMNH